MFSPVGRHQNPSSPVSMFSLQLRLFKITNQTGYVSLPAVSKVTDWKRMFYVSLLQTYKLDAYALFPGFFLLTNMSLTWIFQNIMPFIRCSFWSESPKSRIMRLLFALSAKSNSQTLRVCSARFCLNNYGRVLMSCALAFSTHKRARLWIFQKCHVQLSIFFPRGDSKTRSPTIYVLSVGGFKFPQDTSIFCASVS